MEREKDTGSDNGQLNYLSQLCEVQDEVLALALIQIGSLDRTSIKKSPS